MDRETKAGTSRSVGLGELYTLGHEGTASSDGKLVAGHVMLGTTGSASGVKSNGLSAKEVVTRSNVLGNSEVELSAYANVREVSYCGEKTYSCS